MSIHVWILVFILRSRFLHFLLFPSFFTLAALVVFYFLFYFFLSSGPTSASSNADPAKAARRLITSSRLKKIKFQKIIQSPANLQLLKKKQSIFFQSHSIAPGLMH